MRQVIDGGRPQHLCVLPYFEEELSAEGGRPLKRGLAKGGSGTGGAGRWANLARAGRRCIQVESKHEAGP